MNTISHATARRRRSLWREAIRQPGVWRRACLLGLSVGALQAAVNQGDHWLGHAVTRGVVIKTIVSPLIGFALVFVSASQTWVQRTLEQESLQKQMQ